MRLGPDRLNRERKDVNIVALESFEKAFMYVACFSCIKGCKLFDSLLCCWVGLGGR